jgi:lysozyme
MVREINQAGLDLIKGFEGLGDGDPTTVNLDPYIDPIGIWTIGWGHAIRAGNDFLRGKQNKRRAQAMYPGGITVAQAEALLRGDLLDACRDVESVVTTIINDNQFAALVSFAYNCGLGNLNKSTLLRLVNAKDFTGAAGEFGKWNKAGGQVLPGLTRRRAAEAALFAAPAAAAPTPTVPVAGAPITAGAGALQGTA